MEKSKVFNGGVVTLSILSAFMILAVLSGSSDAKEVTGIGPISQSFVDDNNTLYAFSIWNNTFHVIDSDGSLEWTCQLPYRIPEEWAYSPNFGMEVTTDKSNGRAELECYYDNLRPTIAYNNGAVYLYLVPSRDNASRFANGMLVAVSNGQKQWELPLRSRTLEQGPVLQSLLGGVIMSDVSILAKGDRIYVHHNYNETVISKDGAILWNIEDVSDPASVDEAGFVYCIRQPAKQDMSVDQGLDIRHPSNVIDAYYPNGTLYWERRVDSPLVRQVRQLSSDYPLSLPLYNNGTVYATLYNGITAIGRDGNVKWEKTYDLDEFKFDRTRASDDSPIIPWPDAKGTLKLYKLMSFDSKGNVYLQIVSGMGMDIFVGSGACNFPMYLITIGPDGREISRQYIEAGKYFTAKDGIGYALAHPGIDPKASITRYMPANVTDLAPEKIIAYDVKSSNELWNFTFTATDPQSVVLDKDNAWTLLRYNESDPPLPDFFNNLPIISCSSLTIKPGNGIVFVSCQPMNYEYPIVLGQSRCAYAGGIYAISTDGLPLWYAPVDNSNQIWFSQNGTVFYLTPDGRIGVIAVGAVAGLTLTALYFFYHFFCAGTVTRAKARLNTNENRNRILDFILRNPGSTLYEISRGTGLNLGTVKYHAFILGLNHKITPSRMDGKYVRYFTNSSSYSKDEQLILSLMRRDTIGKVLSLILKKPGISNIEIARELDIQESVVCRCVKELSEKGVIARNVDDARCACTIRESYCGPVEDAVKRLQGQ